MLYLHLKKKLLEVSILGQLQKFTLKQLGQKFKSNEVSIFNLTTNRTETYIGFRIDDMIEKFWNKEFQESNFVVFESSNGYKSYIDKKKFLKNKAYLAFERKGVGKFQVWSSDQEKLVDLGDYYLIWKENYKKGKATKRRNHWSWRVKKISMLKDLPNLIKPSVYASTDTHWGYFNYVKQCLSCHSLNGFGGENGPDLMISKDWEKKSDQWLKDFISNPKSINKKTKMSAFPKKIDIRDIRIKNIVLYLRYLANPRNKEIDTEDKKQKDRYTHTELLQKLEKEKFILE